MLEEVWFSTTNVRPANGSDYYDSNAPGGASHNVVYFDLMQYTGGVGGEGRAIYDDFRLSAIDFH